MCLNFWNKSSAASSFILTGVYMPDCKPQLSRWKISPLEIDHLDKDHVIHSFVEYLFSNTSESGTVLSTRNKLMNKKVNTSILLELASGRSVTTETRQTL